MENRFLAKDDTDLWLMKRYETLPTEKLIRKIIHGN
jgi:hypothetical protein